MEKQNYIKDRFQTEDNSINSTDQKDSNNSIFSTTTTSISSNTNVYDDSTYNSSSEDESSFVMKNDSSLTDVQKKKKFSKRVKNICMCGIVFCAIIVGIGIGIISMFIISSLRKSEKNPLSLCSGESGDTVVLNIDNEKLIISCPLSQEQGEKEGEQEGEQEGEKEGEQEEEQEKGVYTKGDKYETWYECPMKCYLCGYDFGKVYWSLRADKKDADEFCNDDNRAPGVLTYCVKVWGCETGDCVGECLEIDPNDPDTYKGDGGRPY